MKWTLFFLILFMACNNGGEKSNSEKKDTVRVEEESTVLVPQEKEVDPIPSLPVYSNNRFKDVRVEKIGEDSFRVNGKAQVFEATFNWVVEDGHDELKKGYQTTSAGAPEWGNFEFGLRVQKRRENSTLTLILFESSPKDGSRQYELPIRLY
jgi:hypothetical protein